MASTGHVKISSRDIAPSFFESSVLRFKYSGPHTLLARFPVGRADLCASSGLTNESPCLQLRFAIRSKQKVRQGCAPAYAHTTHYADLRPMLFHRSPVELESLSIKPPRPGLFVISERQPKPFKLSNLAITIFPQIDDMRDAQRLQTLDVAPFRHRTAKGEALGDEADFHAPGFSRMM